MTKFQDLTGKRYGNLKVVKHLGINKYGKNIWELNCDCGNITIGVTGNLNRGRKRSCGCIRVIDSSSYIKNVKKALIKNRRIKGSCWEWTGQLDHRGYGRRSFGQGDKNKKTLVHRISYQIFNGPIEEGLCVCHTCDNRTCFNPSHLWIGTLADNLKDMRNKNRQARGEMLPHSKLNTEKVIEIRKRYRVGEKIASIAKDYEMTYQLIYNVCKGKTWIHIL